MRYVTMPQTVILLLLTTLVVDYVSAINQDDDCNGSCNYSVEYCDKFESGCRPCKEHCLNSPFDACERDCPGYLKALLFSAKGNVEFAEKSDITMLMAMLVAVTVVSCLTLAILLVLVTYKVKGRRRREKEVTD